MPILSNFPSGGGTGGGGLALASVTNISTLTSSGKAYVKWTDPNDIVVDETIMVATWGGTLLVRKAGSEPTSRRDGTIVLDSKTRNAYQDEYFCDSGLTNGVTYYYKFFPYTTTGTYTDSASGQFIITPTTEVSGTENWKVAGMAASTEAGDGKMTVKWTDPAAIIESDGVVLATWDSTTIVIKEGGYPTGKDDSGAVFTQKVATRNQYASTPLIVTGLTNGTEYYIGFYPETTDGYVNTDTSQRAKGAANRITIANIPSQSGTLTYDGNSKTPSWSNYDSSKMTLGGATSGTNAGSYTATFTPGAEYRWSDGTTASKNVSWSIGRATIANVPSQSGSLTYNGNTQYPTWSNYDAGKMTIAGSTSGTTAGSYPVTFTPGSNYQWSDNSTTAKTVNWTIGKAAGSLSVSVTSLTLDSSNKTKTFTVTRVGDGKITVSSNNTNVATVSPATSTATGAVTFTVSSVNDTTGGATITVSVAAGTNHNAPSNKTIAITATFKPTASTTAASGVSYTNGLSGLSQSDISMFAEAISSNSSITNTTASVYVDFGSVHRKISVGDQVTIALSGTNYTFDVIGFNHDTLTTAAAYGANTATGKAGITFQMHDCHATTAKMNSSNTNSGGWNGCAMRTSTMATMKNSMPTAWQNIIKPVNKLSGTGGGSSSGTQTTSDSCFLLAEIEIFGKTTYSVSGEGTQYQYYKAGNSTIKNRSGSAYGWWERSPGSGYSDCFCLVDSDGGANGDFADGSIGVAFGFCV